MAKIFSSDSREDKLPKFGCMFKIGHLLLSALLLLLDPPRPTFSLFDILLRHYCLRPRGVTVEWLTLCRRVKQVSFHKSFY